MAQETGAACDAWCGRNNGRNVLDDEGMKGRDESVAAGMFWDVRCIATEVGEECRDARGATRCSGMGERRRGGGARMVLMRLGVGAVVCRADSVDTAAAGLLVDDSAKGQGRFTEVRDAWRTSG